MAFPNLMRCGKSFRGCVQSISKVIALNSHLRSSAFICGFTAFCIASSTAAEISLRDDLDRPILLKQPAKRIVTLAPFLTELVFTAGAGDRVVGVSAYSDYPPEAKRLPQVGTAVS